MRAMVLRRAREKLKAEALPEPAPGPGQVLIRVSACGVCRTDLHVFEGDLKEPKLPLVPGHEIVGRVAALGEGVTRFKLGERVGVPWLGFTCGTCAWCLAGQENLCPNARFTGYQIDGGYAEACVADARYAFALPEGYSDEEAAPLLCAGLIGYRALRMAGPGKRIGLYGFGAAAHIIAQVAKWQGRTVFAFTKPGDKAGQDFARGLGADWAGGSDEMPPERLEAALIFAPVGSLVPAALAASAPGAVIVCAGIHMSDIPSFPYALLWEERVVRSVANLTRQDALEFLALGPKVPVRTRTVPYKLAAANEALADLAAGRIEGAAVLTMS
ncbi:MAG TPA: zinc-dependent alcohol dehydrogenase family protein [Acetobacteraceae bacterium]|jgi:alcohol dehydrogenase, propanol-preferring|nr:zinc-dependent alcohol dehydrogenase family protein [Acetobacteraceae bacterium]